MVTKTSQPDERLSARERMILAGWIASGIVSIALIGLGCIGIRGCVQEEFRSCPSCGRAMKFHYARYETKRQLVCPSNEAKEKDR